MCGIAGKLKISPKADAFIKPMIQSMRHRGPDDEGYFEDNYIALGMARLSIVEIERGRQPAFSQNQKVCVVFNGEIYNYKDIQKVLMKFGYHNARSSEAEIIANLYELYGLDFVIHLKGMFAIAVWDIERRTLLLCRDRFGEKPLYYTKENNGIIFSSEVRPLLLSDISKEVDINALFDVAKFGFTDPAQTMFREIKSLPPAHILIATQNGYKISKYWNPIFQPKLNLEKDNLNHELDLRLQKAVENQFFAERSIGAYLSGGVDSSLIAFYLSKLTSNKLKTFSISFSDNGFDESSYAHQVATLIGSEHHTIPFSGEPTIVDEALLSLDVPLADSSYLAAFQLNKYAANEITVAFGGDGGDESMAGYDRYRASVYLQKFRLLSPIFEHFGHSRLLPASKLTRIFSKLDSRKSLIENYECMMLLNSEDSTKMLFHKDLQWLLRPNVRYSNEMAKLADQVDELTRSDLSIYLPGDLLIKSDLSSMNNSIELRSPFLDLDYFEFALRTDSSDKFNFRKGKIPLKNLASTKLQGVDFYRRKMGFGIPRASLLRGSYYHRSCELLLSKECRDRGWFDQNFLRTILREHRDGIDRDTLIWPALVIESWASNWL